MSHITRRQALLSGLFGVGGVGLRAFASGIPISMLLNPRAALAAAATGTPMANTVDAAKAQYLILATSGSGDPMGCNTPGTYEDSRIVHPPDAAMAPTMVVQNGKGVKGALPWSTLPQATLDRTVFFHHATYTVVHGDEGKTLELNGAVKNNDMLVSMLASQLGPALNTVQVQPVCVGAQGGSEVIAYQGRVQPILTPSSLASVLTLPNGPLSNLQKLRDQTVDSLNAYYRSQGVPAQQNFIDKYVASQTQLRDVSDTLLSQLAAIKDNSAASQVLAAITLFKMNVTPVVSIHIPMGGDNHGDANLAGESAQQTAGLATINNMVTQLQTAGLGDKVSFMMLNVFGRTMAMAHKGTAGRDHNGTHHATIMVGANLKGGVVGGVAPVGNDYGATAIESSTGASNANGDIPFAGTFGAMGKTIGRAVGVSEDFLDANISLGKAVTGALV